MTAAVRPGARSNAEAAPAAGLYDRLSPGDRFIHETRDRALLALLHRHQIDLTAARILEIGCGEGALLRTLLHYGARPENVAAVEIEAGRPGEAALVDRGIGLLRADARSLPYADGAFDLALAFTLLSSVVASSDRRRVAAEALRVLRPGGLLVVYDFWVNPLNPRVRPLSAGELDRLVGPLPVERRRVTLAPPLARALGRWPAACRLLERVPLLRTHHLAAVVKRRTLAAEHGEAFLPFYQPDIGQEEIDEVADTLRSGWLTGGPKVRAFEEAFRDYVGASHGVSVSSCTAGLHLALLAAGIGPGDEVITTPFTFAATVNVIMHAGAKPVLADVSPDDCNLDPGEVERRLSERTRAIIPVHYAGQPCRMDELIEIARRRRLLVIEDAAHAAGARYRGRPVGTLGDATVFSFYVTKNMTTGQGGMVTTESEELAERIRLLSLHGLSSNAWDRYTEKGSWAYQLLAPGFNYVMTDIQAAIGLHQLRRLDAFQQRREQLVSQYDRLLADLPEVIRPAARDDVVHSWHLYPIRLRLERLSIGREEVIQELRRRGIGTSVHYIPVHLHPYYREALGVGPGDFPVAEAAYEGLISLPLYTRMRDADVARVSEALHEILEAGRR